MKEELAQYIYEVIKDYRNEDGIYITKDKIIEWAEQFGNDDLVVLTELKKILPETYISKEKAKQLIHDRLKNFISDLKYQSIQTFLMDTEFLHMQDEVKSQTAILKLLEEILQEQYQECYKKYTDYPKKNYIYFDDVLATGNTIAKASMIFFDRQDDKGNKFYEKMERNEIRFFISLFCIHSWGQEMLKRRLIVHRDYKYKKIIDKIIWKWDYKVDNHIKSKDPILNVALPIKSNNVKIDNYLTTLSANKYEEYAYRDNNKPSNEVFFTNPENRVKFENILTEKGIEIIKKIQGEVRGNIRPLGFVYPSYKIFGLGTHFFTWRNIPNNCPLVYWWEVWGHDWKPLFPLANRGK